MSSTPPSATVAAPRTLLVTARPQVQRAVVEGLRDLALPIETSPSIPADASPKDILLMDVPDEAAIERTVARCRPDGLRPILLCDLSRPEALSRALKAVESPCLVGLTDAGDLALGGLRGAIQRLRGCGQSALAGHFGPDLKVAAWDLRGTMDKAEVLERTSQFCWENKVHPEIGSAVLTVTDELITNAIFDAPVDANGAALYAALPRARKVVLPEGRPVRMQLVFDGNKLAVRVLDLWGSLSKARVTESISAGTAGGVRTSSSSGGAGLGLYYCYSLVQQLLFDIDCGQHTEVWGIVEEVKSYRRYLGLPKSLGVFSQRGETA